MISGKAKILKKLNLLVQTSRPPTPSGHGSPKIRLLVTAYQPFQGRTVNGSQTLLKWAKTSSRNGRWPGLDLRTRLLPVAWKGALQGLRHSLSLARSVWSGLGPEFLLGIGEGKPHRIAWEQRAANQAVGKDETGKEGPGAINPVGPAYLNSHWPFPDTLPTSLPPHTFPIEESLDAGTYLCNRLLWESLEKITPRAAFLHLPPQMEKSAELYLQDLTPVLDRVFETLQSGNTDLSKEQRASPMRAKMLNIG